MLNITLKKLCSIDNIDHIEYVDGIPTLERDFATKELVWSCDGTFYFVTLYKDGNIIESKSFLGGYEKAEIYFNSLIPKFNDL